MLLGNQCILVCIKGLRHNHIAFLVSNHNHHQQRQLNPLLSSPLLSSPLLKKSNAFHSPNLYTRRQFFIHSFKPTPPAYFSYSNDFSFKSISRSGLERAAQSKDVLRVQNLHALRVRDTCCDSNRINIRNWGLQEWLSQAQRHFALRSSL